MLRWRAGSNASGEAERGELWHPEPFERAHDGCVSESLLPAGGRGVHPPAVSCESDGGQR